MRLAGTRSGRIAAIGIAVLMAFLVERLAAHRRERLAWTPLHEGHRLFFEQKRYRAARAAYEEALRRDPTHADAHVGRGRALAAIGDTDGAVAAFRVAIRYRPAWPEPHILLVSTLHGAHRTDQARQALADALKVAPEDRFLQNFARELQ